MDNRSIAMLFALGFIWGGTFFLTEIALPFLSPMEITWHRVFWAAPLLGGFVLIRGFTIPTSPKVWGAYLVMGALNNAIPFTLIFWGQLQLTSGVAAILNGTTAIFGAFVAGLLLRDEPLTLNKLLGAVIGVVGVAVIMGVDALLSLDPYSLAQWAILGASLSYAFAGVWGKTTLADQPPQMNAFGMVSCSALIMTVVVLITDGPPRFAMPTHVWAAVFGFSVLATFVAYLLYFAILKRAGAANLMLVTLIIPVFAMVLGAIGLNETLGLQTLCGFAIIALGLLVTDGRLFRRV